MVRGEDAHRGHVIRAVADELVECRTSALEERVVIGQFGETAVKRLLFEVGRVRMFAREIERSHGC